MQYYSGNITLKILVMKKILIFLFLLLSVSVMSQDRGFNYKAVITDNGSAMLNEDINIRFSIIDQGSNVVYEETHSATTDDNGIVSVVVGEGISTDDFSAIEWNSGNFFLKVEIDTGNGYSDFGASEFKSVPYSKYADKAGNTFSGSYEDLTGKPVDFYKHRTTNVSGSIDDDIYRTGHIYVGDIDSSYWSQSCMSIYQVNNDNDNWSIVGLGSTIINNSSSSQQSRAIHTGIRGDSDGDQYSLQNEMYNSGNGTHYCIYNVMNDSSASGARYGIYTRISYMGNDDVLGSYNAINSIGGNDSYGTFNSIFDYKYSTGTRIGTKNNLFGYGKGVQYGVHNIISVSGNNSHYGIYNELLGRGIGDKYGTYSYIRSSAGGTHYAVYGDAQKAGSYAGYFVGDVEITQKLKAEDSGDADMKAYIYGYIDAAAGIVASKSSDGFTVAKIATGKYRIKFNDTSINASDYIIMANPATTGTPLFITYWPNDGNCDVYIWKHDGTHLDNAFSFVIYKK